MSEDIVKQVFWGVLIFFGVICLFGMMNSCAEKQEKHAHELEMTCLNQGGSWLRAEGAGYLCLRTESIKK